MKLRYILTSLAAAALLATGCVKDESAHLDSVQVSKSYVALPVAGGSEQITVTAKASWSINDIPEWLTVDPAQGSEGETTVKFSAAETSSTNSAVLRLICGNDTQVINVIQMADAI